jgi:hypothetical protein
VIDFDKDIVGREFYFYGVDSLMFKLGRYVFEAVEDESDGYRSYFGSFESRNAADGIFLNRAVARVRVESYEDHSSDGWRLVDLRDGHVWLRVGTDNTDDYYPMFVFDYQPREPRNA